jgi:hypothetical protein
MLRPVCTSHLKVPLLSVPVQCSVRLGSQRCTAQVFRRDSPGKAAQWLARSISES